LNDTAPPLINSHYTDTEFFHFYSATVPPPPTPSRVRSVGAACQEMVPVTGSGRLKMHDRKLQDWKMADNITGVENA